MSRKRNSKLWEYLEASGVLEKGSDEEIKAVRRAYWKNYWFEYKQKQRKGKPEFSVYFSKTNGDYETVERAARKHSLTITGFIHSATLSYIRQTYIVPDKLQVAKLEQLLADCLNEIKTIIKPKERYFWERDQRLELIERRIEKLEVQIDALFRNPTLYDSENKIT